jgi:hypothetical protein
MTAGAKAKGISPEKTSWRPKPLRRAFRVCVRGEPFALLGQTSAGLGVSLVLLRSIMTIGSEGGRWRARIGGRDAA